MRLVLDTNTIVSGLLWSSAPARLIDAALQRRVELFTSRILLLELEDVLPRRKFERKVAASGLNTVQLVARYAILAQSLVPAVITPVLADTDDDHVLACALAARADLIVSGDRGMLNLKSYQGMPVVTATEALTRIAKVGAAG